MLGVGTISPNQGRLSQKYSFNPKVSSLIGAIMGQTGVTKVYLGLTGVAMCLSVVIKGQTGAIVGQRKVIVDKLI